VRARRLECRCLAAVWHTPTRPKFLWGACRGKRPKVCMLLPFPFLRGLCGFAATTTRVRELTMMHVFFVPTESLRWHFEQYGPVISVEVMRDRKTGGMYEPVQAVRSVRTSYKRTNPNAHHLSSILSKILVDSPLLYSRKHPPLIW
jgi:hypothetical protein